MGFGFRKRIKIAPGLHLNLSKKGVSTSVGGNGATVNLSSKGAKATVGIPGTGVSYSKKLTEASSTKKSRAVAEPEQLEEFSPRQAWSGEGKRPVSIWLGIGIFLMPYLFAWFLLRQGYSKMARYLAFSWTALVVFSVLSK